MTDKEFSEFGNLVVYTFFALIAGIVLWRISVAMQKRKARPKPGKYFDNKYREHWDDKRKL